MKNIPYGHHWIDAQDTREVVKVLNSDWVTQGPKIKKFEDALCAYTQAKYAVCVSSGTAALHIACLAAGLKNKDEVVTSPVTFVASANCVLYCGGSPIFADIQTDTGNIDPGEIKKKINKNTKAIIPVHFAGHPCDLEEIRQIAKRYNLSIIEDAAHALGAEYKDSKIGSCKFSEMTIFSFHPVKSITTGEGGAVLTNRKDLFEKLLLLRNHGIAKYPNKYFNKRGPSFNGNAWYYEMQVLGFNYRITDLQCALGISQLKKLERFKQRRREISDIYNKNLSRIQEISLPVEKENVEHAWHLYPIKLNFKFKAEKKRKKIFDHLRGKGIGVQVHYIPVYWQPYYRRLGYNKGICPNAEDFYRREISLPLYPAMSNRDIRYVISNLTGALSDLTKKD